MPEPLVPLRLFANRSVVLAVIASIAVGIALFGTTVFLSQYMQIARAKTPTESGLLTIPMVVGLFLASTIVGRLVTETRPLQALHAHGRGPADRRPGADGNARRDDVAWSS